MLRTFIIIPLLLTAAGVVMQAQQPGAPAPTAPAAQPAAQDLPAPAPPSATAPAPPAASAVAATVNGQTISEIAVFRALPKSQVPRPELRVEIINFLIDNALVDQYLDQLKLDVEGKEIDTQVDKVKTEIAASGWKVEDFYKELLLNEADLRTQIRATLRWEKFLQQYATEKALKEYFETNTALFDNSQLRAKHILVSIPPGSDAQAGDKAKARIMSLKKQIEEQVAQKLAGEAKLDNLELQKKKVQLLTETFAATAAKESDCPTKAKGGELDWFTRGGGRVVEPFARAAFALKPGELSDAVATEYGCHLILCVDFKAGVERKFEDIRPAVKNVYADKMREAIVQRARPTAKIEINQALK